MVEKKNPDELVGIVLSLEGTSATIWTYGMGNNTELVNVKEPVAVGNWLREVNGSFVRADLPIKKSTFKKLDVEYAACPILFCFPPSTLFDLEKFRHLKPLEKHMLLSTDLGVIYKLSNEATYEQGVLYAGTALHLPESSRSVAEVNETMQKLETIWTEHSLQSIEETNEDIMSDAEQRFKEMYGIDIFFTRGAECLYKNALQTILDNDKIAEVMKSKNPTWYHCLRDATDFDKARKKVYTVLKY